MEVNVEMRRTFLDEIALFTKRSMNASFTPTVTLPEFTTVNRLSDGFHHQFVGGNPFGVVGERTEIGERPFHCGNSVVDCL